MTIADIFNKSKKRILKIHKNYKKKLDLPNYNNWVKNSGDEKLKFDYQLQKDSTIFELGAYLGGMVREFEDKFDCNIVAFEPTSKFYDFLIKNFHRSKTKIINKGLSNKNEIKKIIFSNDGTLVKKVSKKNKNYENAKLIKLSDFIKENKYVSVDLVNINIEGSEYSVLQDLISTNTISKIEHVQVQFHRNVPFYRVKRYFLVRQLKKTHNRIWCYDFIWERWDLKNKKISIDKK